MCQVRKWLTFHWPGLSQMAHPKDKRLKCRLATCRRREHGLGKELASLYHTSSLYFILFFFFFFCLSRATLGAYGGFQAKG